MSRTWAAPQLRASPASRLGAGAGLSDCGTAKQASSTRAEAPSTSGRRPGLPAQEAKSTAPLVIEARMKVTEPQTRTRP